MRITGGTEAAPGEFPWQAHVYDVADVGGGRISMSSFCGGSIISTTLVVSAAHCFIDKHTGERNRFTQYRVAVGTNTRNDYYKMKVVRRVVVHEHYDYRATNNDIAMMQLQEPLDWSHEVSPICLPDPGTDFAGKTATVSGWGMLWQSQNQDGPSPDQLMKVDLPIISDRSCQRGWRWSNAFNKDAMICCKGAVNKDPCPGDSGGPMVAEERGHYDLVGVVSFGSQTCGDNLVSVFTRVQHFLPWINGFLRAYDGGNTCPK